MLHTLPTRPLRRLLTLLACLGGLAHAAEEPLPPEQAFRLQTRLQADGSAALDFEIADGYYLYQDKFQFRAEHDLQLGGPPRFAQGEAHEDRFFGKQTIFRNRFSITLPVTLRGSAPRLTTTVQGCSERLGVCYPPFDISAELARASKASPGGGLLPGLSSPGSGLIERPPVAEQLTATDDVDDNAGQLTRLIHSGALLPITLAFFGLGLLLAFTPCMLPMIPILSGIIVGKAEQIDRLRALKLSSAYVLGMATTYAAAGVLAGLSGASLALWLQNIWVLGAFALLFIVLALPMFGLFELQLPASLQSRLAHLANRQHGSLSGIALMGAISALIVGPCMTAPLAAALLAIAQTGQAATGGLALFALALGMGLPLIGVGVMARHWLPKPGPWMDLIKGFFGLLLLGTALWLLYPVLPPAALWLAIAALLALPAAVLWRKAQTAQTARRALRLASTLLCLLVAAASLMALQQSRHHTAQGEGPQFETITSLDALQARLAASHGPVMVDVYADWCVACRELEHYTFRDPGISAQLQGFTLLRLDVTHNNADTRALLKALTLYAPPAMLFFQRGQPSARVLGFRNAQTLGPILARELRRAPDAQR